MDRDRFEQLLEAYGADLNRWPAEERAAAAAFSAARSDEIAGAVESARALDEALALVADANAKAPELLAARILKQRPQRRVFDRRAALALAACAVFGVVLGYGGGLLAPVAEQDDSYFATAFAAPDDALGDEG